MPTLTEFVLETLTHTFVGCLRFRYGATHVHPDGYRVHIAGCVRDGLIEPTIDTSVLGPNAERRSIPAGAFLMERAPGEVHPMFFHPGKFEQRGGEVFVRSSLSVQEIADLRGDVIHECTHALQDWEGVVLDRFTAEGAAYLAGAITRRMWGYRSSVDDRMRSEQAYSLWLADRMIREGTLDSAVPIEDRINMTRTRSRSLGHWERYVYNGIRHAPRPAARRSARR